MRKTIVSLSAPRIFFFFVLPFMVIYCAGCAPSEFSRVVLGVGVRSFKEKGKLYEETFDKELTRCYNETASLFKEMNATPYRGTLKKRYIVAVHFHNSFENKCIDTTEVAVFFEDTADGKTKVIVSSLNYALSEFVSSKLFERLRG